MAETDLLTTQTPQEQELSQPKHHTEPKSRPTLQTKLKLRSDYVRGLGALRPLCVKHGVSFNTAKLWHTTERWFDLRTQFSANEEAKLMALIQPAKPEPPIASNDATTQQGKLDRVEQQLEQVDRLIESSEDSKDINALTQAKDRLLNAWSLLTGFERPGIRRRTKSRSAYQSVQPIEPDESVQPQPVVSKPLGWEYDG